MPFPNINYKLMPFSRKFGIDRFESGAKIHFQEPCSGKEKYVGDFQIYQQEEQLNLKKNLINGRI